MTNKAEQLYADKSDSFIFERGWKKAKKKGKHKTYAFIFAKIWKNNPDMKAYRVALNALHKSGIDVKANLKPQEENKDGEN